MKINVVLLAFIMITFNVFKATIFPNTAIVTLEATFLPITLHTDGLESAFANISNCDGLINCVVAIAHSIVAIIFFIGELFRFIFYILADFILLNVLFWTIAFSPLPTGTPLVINAIVMSMSVIMTLIAVISFIPGED